MDSVLAKNQKSNKVMRNSNLELYRIVLMLGIIAHHYVVNSGLLSMLDFNANPLNTVYLQLFGWFGKTGINCFLLITGYFMCKQNFKWQKFLKLYLEIKFYKLIIYFIFVVSGYQEFSLGVLFKSLFSIAYSVGNGFTSSFVALYLLIPFLNILIKNLNKKLHFSLILILILVFTVTSTFFFNASFEYIGWYCTIYIIGAFLRLYPVKFLNNKRFLFIAVVLANAVVWLSILLSDFGLPINAYYLVSDSNKIMALITSVLMFSLFNNIKVKQSKWINTVASSVFGVLLIHANSDTMRTFLWCDVLKCTDYFNAPIYILLLHSVLSVIGVFTICVIIDQIRIIVLEKPLFNLIYTNSTRIENFFENKYQKMKKHICFKYWRA